jgi:hypothetical protein
MVVSPLALVPAVELKMARTPSGEVGGPPFDLGGRHRGLVRRLHAYARASACSTGGRPLAGGHLRHEVRYIA